MYNIWINPLHGVYPKTYIVMVDGTPRDTLFQKSGKWLSRNDMRDICDGYREWYASEWRASQLTSEADSGTLDTEVEDVKL